MAGFDSERPSGSRWQAAVHPEWLTLCFRARTKRYASATARSGGHIAGESHGLRHSPRALCIAEQRSDTHSPLWSRAGTLGHLAARDSREPISLSCLRPPHLLAAEGDRADTTTSIRHRPRRLPQEEHTKQGPTRLPADSALQIPYGDPSGSWST